ncbi:hypothetical protein D3C71_1958330 [compost metagenome]
MHMEDTVDGLHNRLMQRRKISSKIRPARSGSIHEHLVIGTPIADDRLLFSAFSQSESEFGSRSGIGKLEFHVNFVCLSIDRSENIAGLRCNRNIVNRKLGSTQ